MSEEDNTPVNPPFTTVGGNHNALMDLFADEQNPNRKVFISASHLVRLLEEGLLDKALNDLQTSGALTLENGEGIAIPINSHLQIVFEETNQEWQLWSVADPEAGRNATPVLSSELMGHNLSVDDDGRYVVPLNGVPLIEIESQSVIDDMGTSLRPENSLAAMLTNHPDFAQGFAEAVIFYDKEAIDSININAYAMKEGSFQRVAMVHYNGYNSEELDKGLATQYEAKLDEVRAQQASQDIGVTLARNCSFTLADGKLDINCEEGLIPNIAEVFQAARSTGFSSPGG